VPIIDKNPRRTPGAKAELEAETRRQRYAGYRLAEDLRYNERSGAERVHGRLKDDFGGRYVRVRGHAKVLCHPDVRHPGADLRSTLAIDRLTAIRAPPI
jgi:hypothetical protein